MYLLHGLNGGEENVFRLLPCQRAGLIQPCFQRFAFHEVHDDIGRLVFLKNIPHPHHIGEIVHLGHFSGLFQEHLHTVLPCLPGLLVGIPCQIPGAGIPADLTGGVVFLDGDLPLHGKVPADIGDAEAALTQHFSYDVSAVQNRPIGKHIIGCGGLRGVKAADGAGVAVNFLHTAKTAIKFHVSLLFQWPDVRFRVPGDDHYSKIISLLDDVVYCLSGDFIIANLQNLRLRGVRQF